MDDGALTQRASFLSSTTNKQQTNTASCGHPLARFISRSDATIWENETQYVYIKTGLRAPVLWPVVFFPISTLRTHNTNTGYVMQLHAQVQN